MKKVTISSIANELQLSPTTISFILNNRQDKGISEATRQRVLRHAEQVGYKRVQRSMLAGWRKVAMLTTDIANFNFNTSFFAEVYSFLIQKSTPHKLEFFLRELDLNDKIKAFHQLRQLNAIDISIFLTSSVAVADFLRYHHQQVILIQGGTSEHCISIRCDDYAAGKMAAKHALQCGHRRAGMIFPEIETPRFTGFYKNFIKGGGSCPTKFQWRIDWSHNKMEKQLTALAAASELPTIFYCFADNIMFPAMRAFAHNNLTVPDDISLIGTDNLYWGRYTQPSFTTINLCEELFADKVIEGIEQLATDNIMPYSIKVPVKLVERETVAKLS